MLQAVARLLRDEALTKLVQSGAPGQLRVKYEGFSFLPQPLGSLTELSFADSAAVAAK